MIVGRRSIEEQVAATEGVEFVVSCVTGTQSHPKKKRTENTENRTDVIRSGLGLFVVCRQASVEDEVHKDFLDHTICETDCKFIGAREKDRTSKETAVEKLMLMLKVRLLSYFPK